MRPNQPVSRINLPQDALAAVPHILGFHPQDSLVILLMQDKQVVTAMRTDLPAVHQRRAVADNVVRAVRSHNATEVMFFVFGGGPVVETAEVLPHAELVAVLRQSMDSIEVHTAFTAWAESSASGARWCSYEDPDRNGTLPDPNATELAAASAAAGRVTYADRAELAAQVAPVDDEVLARRAAMLDGMPEWSVRNPDAPTALRLVRDTIAASNERHAPLSDDEIVQLARALCNSWVRDACLSFAVGDMAEAAERLWLELTRGCPAPERANPAALLAYSAYARGNGPLASVALDQASFAHPGHRLSVLLGAALEAGMPPQKLTEFALGTPSQVASDLIEEGDNTTI